MNGGTVVLVTREGLGSVGPTDARFGIELFDRFLHTLEGRPDRPTAICFYTDGVKLVRKDSPVVMSLKLIEGMGTRLVICRTCLDYFGLADQVGVGEVGSMADIVALLSTAHHVVTV
jgi:hypothetical protein